MHWIAFYFLLLTNGLDLPSHEVHVSMAEIYYNEEQSSLEMVLSVFIDDLDNVLEDQGYGVMHLCTKLEHANADSILHIYLSKHLQIEANQEPKDWFFIGKQISDDLAMVECYLEITDLPDLSNLKISNTLLFDHFDDQKNIMHVFGPDKKQDYIIQSRVSKPDAILY